MTTLDPIVRPTPGYASGLGVTWISNTTIRVEAGSCSDSTNTNDITLTSNIILNAATNGLNGLDTGTFAASKVYAVFVIGDQAGNNAPGVLMSLSPTAPLMPKGTFSSNYNMFRRVGWAISDGSTHFYPLAQAGTGLYRQYSYDAAPTVLSGGSQITTFASIVLTAVVPPIGNYPIFTAQVSFTPATAADYVCFRTTGSSASASATTLESLSGVVAAKAQTGQLKMFAGISAGVVSIDYINSAASGATTVSISGFEDYLA